MRLGIQHDEDQTSAAASASHRGGRAGAGQRGPRPGPRHRQSEAAAAARQSGRSRDTPAKELFGRRPTPAPLEARVIGFYSKGCLAGAKALPINGKTWQVMRLSRNRNWGHPDLVEIARTAVRQRHRSSAGAGLLVGDMSQPRGGPMLTGHASHQIGLDADIWLTPMPDRELTPPGARGDVGHHGGRRKPHGRRSVRLDAGPRRHHQGRRRRSRRSSASSSMRRSRRRSAAKPATTAPGCTRCGPYYGHNYHFHVRIKCPAGNADCKAQDPVPAGERLRQGTRPLVQRRDPASQAVADSAAAATADQDGRTAAGLPAGPARAVIGARDDATGACAATTA